MPATSSSSSNKRPIVSAPTISGELQISNEALDRVIATRLAELSGPIAGAQIEALDDDTFTAQLSPRARLLPAVRIVARIEQQPELPDRPRLGLRWSIPGMGPLGLLAAPVLTFLKALPPGIQADEDRIVVDIGDLLRAQGLDDLLRHVSRLRVHTRMGAVIVRFDLTVP